MADLVPECQGRLRVIEVSPPSAGVEFTVTQDARLRWRLILVYAQYVSSIIVATRRPSLVVGSAGVIKGRFPIHDSIAAGETAYITWISGGGQDIPTGLLTMMGSMSVGMLVNNSEIIRSLTENIQIADQWSNVRLLVEEWLEPLT